jgi:hypothetical protein
VSLTVQKTPRSYRTAEQQYSSTVEYSNGHEYKVDRDDDDDAADVVESVVDEMIMMY